MQLKRTDGFTMIEMAIIIVIVGLIVAAYISLDKVYKAQQNEQVTLDNMDAIRQAILEYQAMGPTHGYPTPAGLALGPSAINYGMALSPPGSLNPGVCTGEGLCRVTSGDGPAGLPAHDYDKDGKTDLILIGAVPFKTLLSLPGMQNKVSQNQTLDAWGNKILYAVTETMTGANFNPGHGVIHVIDEHGQNILNPIDSAHFILLSYGKDGQGAYTLDGRQNTTCTLNQTETPNCLKTLGVTQGNTATFVDALRYIGAGASYYDDILKYQSFNISALWDYSPTVSGSAYNVNPGDVGLNTKTPNNKLDVNGSFLSHNMDAKNLCDATGVVCYNTDVIAGDGVKCPTNQVMTGLGRRTTGGTPHDVAAECATPSVAPTAQNKCPVGQFAVGYSTASGFICCSPGDKTCPN